jgi:hypothetical protein
MTLETKAEGETAFEKQCGCNTSKEETLFTIG